MASTGLLRAEEKDTFVVSLIPKVVLGTSDGHYTLDMGVGGALLSRHRLAKQDFGDPFQFALTAGMSFAVYKQLSLGYRFMHYSDAGIHGPDTKGADLHMIELIYRFQQKAKPSM